MAYTLLEISYTFVAIGLLVYFFRTSQKFENSLFKSCRHWFLFGFIFNFYSLSWLYTVYPLAWMEEGVTQLLGITFLHLVLTIISALGFLMVGLRLRLPTTQKYKPLIFALSLTLAEIIRSLLLSIIYLGEGTTINLTLTAGTLGNALSTTPLIEYAYFGGVFGLTFILGYLVFILSNQEHLKRYLYHVLIIILLLIPLHFLVPVKIPQQEIGVITTNFPSYSDEDYLTNKTIFNKQAKQVHEMTLSFSSTTNILVYPEDTRYISSLSERDLAVLHEKFPKSLFVDGNTISHNNTFSNVSFFYKPQEKRTLVRGKEFLLPFNEYIPFAFVPILSFFFPGDALTSYQNNHTYTPIYSKKTILFEGERVGTLLCSEILSYSVIKRLGEENPDVVFFQSRLNVFHNNPWFIMHERSFTKVAASQLRTTLISSANGAPSFIVSPYGSIIKTLPTGFSTSSYLFK